MQATRQGVEPELRRRVLADCDGLLAEARGDDCMSELLYFSRNGTHVALRVTLYGV